MANIFSKSLNDLGAWLQTPGRRLPAGSDDIDVGYGPGVAPPQIDPKTGERRAAPQGYTSPTNQAVLVAQGPSSRGTTGSWQDAAPTPVWNPSAPSPLAPPSRGTTGSWQDAGPNPADLASRIPQGATPLPEPYREPVPAAAPYQPTPYISPTNQAAMAAQQQTLPTSQPSTAATPAPTANQPSTAQPSTAQPSTAAKPSPTPYTSPTNQAAMASQQHAPTKVTHSEESPTHKTVVTSQVKTPQQPQPAAGGNKPWTYGAPPGQPGQPSQPGQGQGAEDVNLQVPAHPGLLQRIGQTISHFFGGTLGQHPTVGQYGAGAPQPGAGQTQSLGQLPESSALSGIHSALVSGRQHVATHGPSAPASARTPVPAMAPTGYVSGAGSAAEGPTGQESDVWTASGQPQPLGDTGMVRGPNGELYRYDITNPRNYTRIQ